MKPYYQDNHIQIFNKDCRSMEELGDESIDLLVTDPPYGIGFMGKDWDTFQQKKPTSSQVVSWLSPTMKKDTRGMMEFFTPIWKECLRVLKPGAFAFVMCIPRQDCLAKMICSLQDAGFETGFTSIYWAYASGFPKAQNIGKAVDKRLGTYKEGEPTANARFGYNGQDKHYNHAKITREFNAQSPQAKALDGSYGGFQPKPAVEVILVCMKPLSEKTFVDQALDNRKGITWLDDGRIPYESEGDKESSEFHKGMGTHVPGNFTQVTGYRVPPPPNPTGRFPANLLVSDDVLNDGRVTKSGKDAVRRQESKFVEHKLGKDIGMLQVSHQDSGSFSRYFDLDKWWAKTFPFLIVPKASKSEKNRGCEDLVPEPKCEIDKMGGEKCTMKTGSGNVRNVYYKNNHPTVKPLKLMSYLITLGSREGDTVLDPFSGSGTTLLASQLLNRKCIGIEIEEKYCEIAANRCRQMVMELEV